MLHHAMLDKERIVMFVVSYVEMGVFHKLPIWFHPVSNVHKDTDLRRAPIHALDLVLNLKSVVLSKINMRQNHVFAHTLHRALAVIVLPPCDEVMPHKLRQFRLQVFKKYFGGGLFIDLYDPLPRPPIPRLPNDFIFETLPGDSR